MARPAKRNCDYFPHFVAHERDLYCLETRFGIEGYYFFYTLREFLSNCDNLTYKMEVDADLDYFYKSFALNKERIQEIMAACADNAIIDHDLWYKAKIIWQDDLASILQDAWRGRKDPPPEKPMVDIEQRLTPRSGVSTTINSVSNPINSVSNSINTQRKEKDIEMKINENKINNTITDEITPDEIQNILTSGNPGFQEYLRKKNMNGSK